MSFPTVPIGAAFDVRNGATPSSSVHTYWDGEIPWVSPADLGKIETRYITTGARSISKEGYESCGTQMVPAGSIILSTRAPIGHIAIATQAMCFNQGCRGLVPRKIIGTNFAYWALVAHTPSLQAAGQGTTFIELARDKLRAERIPLPDLLTQKVIADFLDRETARIDLLIEKKQRLVQRLAEREKALLHSWFSRLEAKRWRTRHVGNLNNGAGFPVDLQGDPSEGIAFFKVKHLKTFGLDAAITATEDTVSAETARKLRATVFPVGTIVFAKIGAALLLGRFSMIGRPACLDNNMAAFVPNKRMIDSDFCLLALSQIDMATMVQPGAVPSLSTEAFYSYELPLPSLEEQQELVSRFRSERATLSSIADATKTSIDRLREFRAALITAAVTGQIDPETWSRRGTTDRRLDQIEAEMGA